MKPKVHPIIPSFTTTDSASSFGSLTGSHDSSSTSFAQAFHANLNLEENNRSGTKRFLKSICPAPHSLQNILPAIFLLQTLICIGSMILLIYSSGEKSIDNIATIQADSIHREIQGHMANAKTILEQLHEQLSVVNHLQNETYDWPVYSKKIINVFAPTKLGYPMATIFHYANSFKVLANIEMSAVRNRVGFSNGDGTLRLYSYDKYYQAETLMLTSTGFDPTKRPWYLAGSKKTFPDFAWSSIYNNFALGCISIGAATAVNFNTFNISISNNVVTKTPITQVLVAHFDLYQLDYVLNDTIKQYQDMQTKSMQIVILERSGYILTTSIGVSSVNVTDMSRVHITQTNEIFAKIATILMDKKVILRDPKTGNLSALSTDNTTQVFFVDQYRVSLQFLNEGNGLDWVVVLVTENYGFVKTVFTSSPELLSLSIILVVLGTVLAILITQLLSYSIMKVARDMSKISRLEVDQVKSSKLLKTVHELHLLQTSTKLVKSALHSFMKYIPREIVKDIVRNGIAAKVGVTSCSTSIMFTDIADFTTFSETAHVSVLLKVLSEYFRIITEAVETNNGVIDKFIGDGTMSLFSHPLKIVDDHAERCCHAALQAMAGMEKLRIVCKREGWPQIKIRAGVNTGNAMIGNVGSKDRFNYTAIGDSVNTAGRLETLNKRYDTSILIGQNTYDLVSKKFLCLFVDIVKLKGKAKPIEVYTLESELSEATKKQVIVHDYLQQTKEHMTERNYSEMVSTLDQLIESIDAWIEDEDAKCQEEVNELKPRNPNWYGHEGICFSNLKFIKDLRTRGQELNSLVVHSSVEKSFMDFTLTLNEK
ncbi:hypothetical protein C9374_012253 [Naegleria lovaniensis]|uniref:Guanylate cyclase domain-containing protein n=1 Tax=Naegleria lovaniensis TaxID=51637 RepID=A0AA88KI05_NAELO|nr:uncharacterized protein C9374_012253 [Naegleria lovaniensis]KAG2373387.1 hypothetical protein C9374_012253 [Naegleria lovaniensis]